MKVRLAAIAVRASRSQWSATRERSLRPNLTAPRGPEFWDR